MILTFAMLILAVILGYLLGAIPMAELVARSRGKSAFAVGSGNMGAMNVARNIGWGAGVAVLLLDLAKGMAAGAVGIGLQYPIQNPQSLLVFSLPFVAGVAAVWGHVASVFVGFRGGKALATGMGFGLLLFPFADLMCLLLLVVLILILRKVGVGSSLAAAFFPLIVLFITNYPTISHNIIVGCAVAVISAIIIYKHIPDIKRELQTEQTVKAAKTESQL